MTRAYHYWAALLFACSLCISAQAQVPEKYEQYLLDYEEVRIEVEALKETLTSAPLRGVLSQNRKSQSIISFPMPDGTTQKFRVVEAPILSPELSAQRPDFKSYIAQGIDDPTANARFNITPLGYYGIISGINGISIIEPIDKFANDNRYITYYDHHILTDETGLGVCNEAEHHLGTHNSGNSTLFTNSCFQNGANLRTYDMVVTCSGEFYQLNGGTDAAAEAALLNRVTQINSVYEPEVAISFNIVEYLLNSNAATDPFTDPLNTSQSLTQGEDYINNNVTVGSWDIGHSFHEITCGGGCGWAGIAGLGVVCTSSKARGYTYLPNDIPSNITVLVHEIGHMFSCRHTNYGCNSNNNCGRYEPGRGSTIMSTGAGCDAGDFFANRTDYFGIGSLQAIMDYSGSGTRLNNNSSCTSSTVGGWSDCSTSTSTGNNPPTSDANSNSIDGLTIPKNTPFMLTGSGSDPDGTGSLTYNWEQFDTDYSGSEAPDDAALLTEAPLFRSFPPSTSNERSCPQLSSVLAGNVTTGTGEILPNVARTMNWRLTVRDNEAGGGGIACDEVSITVGNDGPFRITSQNSSTAWSAGDPATITWDVANTDNPTYTCPNVDILYSSDGGNNFSVTLASNVANDGSESITVPATATTTGRIKIVCTGGTNIFFDINDVNIAVVSGCTAEGGTIANSGDVTAPEGDASLNLTLCAGTAITSFVGELDSGDPSSNLAIEDNGGGTCTQIGNSPNYESLEFAVASNGSVNFTTSFASFFNMLTLYENGYDPANECNNWLNSNGNLNGGTVNVGTSISQTLSPGTKYILLSSDFNSGAPSPGDFDITISTTVYDIGATTPTGFLYTYVIVDGSGNIVTFDENTDLSNPANFPADDYTIYGLSYQNGENINTYLNGPFGNLQTALVNGVICGDLSTNSVLVFIQAPLPVEIIDFNARLNGDVVDVFWQTETEINNDYFLVEKSIDGRNFLPIGTVQGAGSTFVPQQYSLLDKNPFNGVNYYRLTQFDYDGTSHVIDRIVSFDYQNGDKISILPNPVKGTQLQLIYPTDNTGTLSVTILNTAGQVVRDFAIETAAGRNVFDLNLGELSSGVYIIQTTQLNKTQSLRFVKTD